MQLELEVQLLQLSTAAETNLANQFCYSAMGATRERHLGARLLACCVALLRLGAAQYVPDKFDPGIHQESPANVGGWCATHGNVACILDEVKILQ